jgi:tetratricopeptide (TPR) repeat protein
MKRDHISVVVLLTGIIAAVAIARWNDAHQGNFPRQFVEDKLQLNDSAMKRITLAFNGIAADWYWMRSLQYVGGKIVRYEDTHDGRFDLRNLSSLDLGLLPSLLRMTTTLDPQFLDAYYYGAVILPDLDANEAIALLERGIAANPDKWKLYQHLGYIYWQRHDYPKAAEAYAAGGQLAGAPSWMLAMGARMKAEGGAQAAAREMYAHLYETADDIYLKQMVEKQLMRLDSLEDLAKIRQVLSDYAARSGRCAASWKEIATGLRVAGLRVDASEAPLDPAKTPYRLSKSGCDVELDERSPVPQN